MDMKISPVKWRPFCPGGDELTWHKEGLNLPALSDCWEMTENENIFQCFQKHILYSKGEHYLCQ